jgi:hypothetical protein
MSIEEINKRIIEREKSKIQFQARKIFKQQIKFKNQKPIYFLTFFFMEK